MNDYDIYSTLEGVFKALKFMGQNKNAIKIIRAHQAPFNLEGDIDGYFKYVSKETRKTFLETCADAGIHLFLASHHHSAQIWKHGYSDVTKGLQSKKKDDKLKAELEFKYKGKDKDKGTYTLVILN